MIRIPWKRVWIGWLVLGLALAACAPAATPTPPPAPSPTPPPAPSPTAAATPTPAPVTLTLAHPTWWGDYKRYKEKYIPEFERMMAQKGTPVKIELMELPAPDDPYREGLLVRLAAGTGPDIWAEDTFWIPADAEAGYLLDLTDKVQAWEWNQWIEAAKGAVTFKGRVWGLNRDTDVRPLYYRKDIFQAAGLPVPFQPKSWDEILEAARRIKSWAQANRRNVIPIAIKAGSLGGEATTMQGFWMLYLGAGGELYDAQAGKWVIHRQPLLDTFGFYYDIYIREKLSTDPAFWLAGKPVDQIHLMLSNVGQHKDLPQLAMLVSWDGVWGDTANPQHERYIPVPPGRDAVLGYAMMPAKAPGRGIRGQDFVTISGGWAEVINAKVKGTPKEAAAWEWLKFVYSKDQARDHLLEEGGGLPARKDVQEDPAWRAKQDPYTLWRAQNLVPLTTFRPGLPAYPEISKAIQQATDRILAGETPEKVVEWFAGEVKRIVGADRVIEK